MPRKAKTLGEAILRRREQLGLSQHQAHKQLEVTRLTYRLWEMNASVPDIQMLPRVAQWLEVSVHEVLAMAGVPVFEGLDRCKHCGGTGRAPAAAS